MSAQQAEEYYSEFSLGTAENKNKTENLVQPLPDQHLELLKFSEPLIVTLNRPIQAWEASDEMFETDLFAGRRQLDSNMMG